MRYWDEDHPDWDAQERDFAAAWRSQPKWVVSRSSKSIGPNATLVADDVEAVIRGLKAELAGEIAVGGPDLARSLTDLGLRPCQQGRSAGYRISGGQSAVFVMARPHGRMQDEPYSITSSAVASNPGGIVRPSVLAVLRLTTSSYLVGACTGRSAGFSPLRMRST
jgi:hypothetical protein